MRSYWQFYAGPLSHRRKVVTNVSIVFFLVSWIRYVYIFQILVVAIFHLRSKWAILEASIAPLANSVEEVLLFSNDWHYLEHFVSLHTPAYSTEIHTLELLGCGLSPYTQVTTVTLSLYTHTSSCFDSRIEMHAREFLHSLGLMSLR